MCGNASIRKEEQGKENQRRCSKLSRASDRFHTGASPLLESELQMGTTGRNRQGFLFALQSDLHVRLNYLSKAKEAQNVSQT